MERASVEPEMQHPLLIFPYNGNGIEALDCLGIAYQLIGFIDDTPEKQGNNGQGYCVYDREALVRAPDAYVLAVPGSPSSYRMRKQIIESLGVGIDRFARVIHPSATVSSLATLGSNVLIMAGVVVTSNAVVGDHVCVLPNTVIHHDVIVGAWSLVGSNVTLAGCAVIGENCYIGSGSSIMNGVRIGDGALVGIGANVIRDVPSGSRVVGNPARPL
jgi:sugar O-acyltransferase (sialic acid O-acetyltransferase NeuD family)